MRRALALWLLAAAASPAAATTCLVEKDRTVVLLFAPSCVQGQTLMYRQKNGDSVDTWITESWPGWGGGEDKCKAAVRALKDWRKDLLVLSTLGGKIGFPGVDKYGFVETPRSCYELRSGGRVGDDFLKGLKQVTLDELIEKGSPKK